LLSDLAGDAFILLGSGLVPWTAGQLWTYVGMMYILKYMKYFSVAEARAKLAAILDSATKSNERTVITRNGEPAAVVMSLDDYESMNETLDILADPELTKYILEHLDNPDLEPSYSIEEVMAEVEARRRGEANREAV
jgi:prevent-host-death family protein